MVIVGAVCVVIGALVGATVMACAAVSKYSDPYYDYEREEEYESGANCEPEKESVRAGEDSENNG